jgi:hypothetical protein
MGGANVQVALAFVNDPPPNTTPAGGVELGIPPDTHTYRMPTLMSARSGPLALLFLGLASVSQIGAQTRPATSGRTVWPDEGPMTWKPQATASEITANDLRTRIYGLADDSMRGRRIGELGNFKGTQYIANEFRRLGLKPGGDSGTFFQVLPYGATGFDTAAIRMSVAGSAVRLRQSWIPSVPSVANGFGTNANWTNAPTVFAGRWGDTAALDPSMLRGKIAVFIAPPAAQNLGGGRGGPPSFVSCSDVPDKFGAAAAMAVEAAPRPQNPRPAGNNAPPPTRDTRAIGAGAA